MQFTEKEQYQGNILPRSGSAQACRSQRLTLGIFLGGLLADSVETGVSASLDRYSSAMLADWQAPGIFFLACVPQSQDYRQTLPRPAFMRVLGTENSFHASVASTLLTESSP